MNKIWNNYPEIQEELKEVVSLMKKYTKCKDKKIENSILGFNKIRGKTIKTCFCFNRFKVWRW